MEQINLKVTLDELAYPVHCLAGKMSLPSLLSADAVTLINNARHLAEWKAEFTKRFGTCNIHIDESAEWYDLFKVIDNPAFYTWQRQYITSKRACLQHFGTTE